MRKTQQQFVVNQSMSATYTSPSVGLDQDFGYAIQANFITSGTLGGTFTLQGSVDHRTDQQGNVLIAGNWCTLAQTAYTISGAGSYMWNVTDVMYAYVRLVYTAAGGDTGTLNCFIQTRGF